MATKLKDRQQKFVNEYLIDGNATQAAIRAGYSAKTANQIGPRLLVNVGVAAAINAARNQTAKRVEITHDMVTLGLLAETQRTGLGTSQGARVQAWVNLGKHIGYFAEDNAQKSTDFLTVMNNLPADVRGRLLEKFRGISVGAGVVGANPGAPAARTSSSTH